MPLPRLKSPTQTHPPHPTSEPPLPPPGAPALLTRPNPWIVLTSIFILFPLSLLRDLSALAFGSVIGNAGTLFTAFFTLLRLVDGSYAPGGRFHMAVPEVKDTGSRCAYLLCSTCAMPRLPSSPTERPSPLPRPPPRPPSSSVQVCRPKLSPSDPILSSGIFVLISMLSTAYVAHYNAPRFYEELAGNKDGSSKLPKFNKVCLPPLYHHSVFLPPPQYFHEVAPGEDPLPPCIISLPPPDGCCRSKSRHGAIPYHLPPPPSRFCARLLQRMPRLSF
jgi:hypothetical protein